MKPSTARVTSTQWSRIAPFVLISLVCFLLGSLLLCFMVWKGEKLIALGLSGRMFYIVLIPIGLSAAGFLFGALKSEAIYSGRQPGGTLILGGPIVALLLVVILGFFLVPDLSTFPLTVYVHGPGGRSDIVLRNTGEVFMDLDGDRRHVAIGDQGQAYFPAIPANFRAQSVPLWVVSDQFESTEPDRERKLDGRRIYLPVHRKAGRVKGLVESDTPGCLAAAQVHVAGLTALVDPASGQFDLTIPGDRLQDDLILEASAPGCVSESHSVIPDSNAIVIRLRQRATKPGTTGP